ncbi:eukaryotic translation initiation factor 2A [Tribolium madens]|uniref:eukaryotic translation initiation factor 2A n=1 Tax=Tribolium madens TaxID=41895 RepID=UPI001CF73897|nr:eukaryotic translation initiation factor 2A [Tribolium madens]
MASAIPFAARSSGGITLNVGPPVFNELGQYGPVQSKTCKLMLFSPDGQYFAFVDGSILKIVRTDNWKEVATIQDTKACYLSFSPKSTYLMSWEQFYVTKDDPQGKPNLNIYKSENGELVKSFIHKKQGNWEPQWSADEKLFSRIVNTDVVFYEDLNFEKIVVRINCHKIAAFSLSPNVGTYFILCHVPGASGQPSFGKLFKYPNFDAMQSIASKSFFQADKVEFYWNSKGSNALLLTTTEVDKTGGSYYGKQGLHFVGLNGQTAMVAMSKEGPIYSVAWSPKNHEFCVVYGFVPAKATIFNLKCEPVFEFGTGPRNSLYYNPQGNLVLLGGFGNLRGHVEVWDVTERKMIGNCEAPDSTLLEWSPDGIHFLTATTAPRLRIGNGYKIWHYSGALLHEKNSGLQEELYEVCWKKFPKYAFKDPVITSEKVEGIATSQPVASKQAYRPPSARNRPTIRFSLDDDEEQSHKPGADSQSKASLKQKKKREAKKAKKLEAGEDNREVSAPVVSSVQINLTGDPEKDKKLKNIKKKLDAIEKLKEQQAQGKPLEINQLSKIKGEADLLKELEQLQV